MNVVKKQTEFFFREKERDCNSFLLFLSVVAPPT